MTRFCTKCGALHGMVVENRETGERKDHGLCHDCTFENVSIRFDPHIDLDGFGRDLPVCSPSLLLDQYFETMKPIFTPRYKHGTEV